MRSIKFTSSPVNAVVTRDGHVLGSTPFTYQFPMDDFPLKVRFDHPRFEGLDRNIELGTDAVSGTLIRKSAPRSQRTVARPVKPSGKSKKQRSKTAPSGKGKSDSGKLKVPSTW